MFTCDVFKVIEFAVGAFVFGCASGFIFAAALLSIPRKKKT